jgi:ferredoxin-NADP reductase
MSMLQHLVSLSSDDPFNGREISWIHGTRSPSEHLYKEDIAKILVSHPRRVKANVFYSQRRPLERMENEMDGWVDLGKLDREILRLDAVDAHYL